MGKLDELIRELCPDGVELKKLSDVCEFRNGFAFKSNLFKDVGTPVIRITNIQDDAINDDDLKYIDMDDYSENLSPYIIHPDNIVIAMSGATTGKIGINKTNKEFLLNQRVGLFIPKKNMMYNHFLYHYLLTKTNYFYHAAGGGAQPNLSAKTIRELIIPVPPQPVQAEIVRILDNFTELSVVLRDELAMRQTQYRYYSTTLFDNAKKHNVCPIKEVCHIEKGKTPIQKAVAGLYPLVVTTSERKSCCTYQFDTEAVCIPMVSSRGHGVASLNHVYYQEGKFALGNILCAIIPKSKENLMAKYLYYYFEQTKDYTLVPLMKGGANVALHIGDIEKVKIPVPPLAEQERIVSILDRFDALCNDISEGLPAEIEARQKQYEYYRDKLLTFKEYSDG